MDNDCSTGIRRPAPWHEGELRAQEQAGVRSQMERIGAIVLRDYMPEQHREFFSQVPTLFIGGNDADGDVWASVLWGNSGFMQSPNPATLHIRSLPAPEDPLATAFGAGARLGCLGLQFETRRRNRANGIVADVSGNGFTFVVEQSFGNCPKYIQMREPMPHDTNASPDAPDAAVVPVMRGMHGVSGTGPLPEIVSGMITRCDTFFIATSNVGHGPDVSHRGGLPGFVRVDGYGVISWPDFQGNNFFNTIGNILSDPRAGLLFLDFERGDMLQLSGRATVKWDGPEVEQFAGAKRMLSFIPKHYVLRQGVFPLRWTLREVSPHLEATGRWN